MVGFIHQDESQETNPSSKLKNPVVDSTWCDNLDFLDQFVPEIEDFSLPVNSSFLDFDSIKDWIEEMQDSEAEKCSETVTSNGGYVLPEGPCVEENLSLEKLPIGDIELQKLQEIPTNEHNQSSLNCITGEGNLLTVEIKEELVAVDASGECLEKEREGFMNSAVEDDAEKLLSLNSVVEEGLGKVRLVDEVESNHVDQSSRKDNEDKVEEAESDESSASESEIGSSSDSSSSSSSSSSEDEDAVEEGKKDVVMDGICEVKEELEEGEIMETDAYRIVSRRNEDDNEDHSKDSFSKGGASGEILMADDDDEDVVVGPIMSKNELKVLPQVPPVDVTLQPSHQMLPVGIVNSILGAQVIIEGGEKHNPLNEGSILWITEKKCPLGRVDEIFGPVKNPYYIVRYNSESEVPEGIHEGSLVSFVPEFVDHVLNNKNLYQKGYDASGNEDEEVEEAEFSDDEQEAEYRRMIKMSKRGNKGDVKPGGYKKSNKSLIRNDTRSNNSNLGPLWCNNNVQFQSPIRGSPPPNHNVQQLGLGPAGFPQQGQPSGFRPSVGGMPFQMQNQAWAPQQQQEEHPMMNVGPPFQQASYPPGNMVPNQVQMSMVLQAQLAQLSMLSGMLLAGQQQGGPPTLNPPQFNQGTVAPFQARATTPFQGRGARFPGRGGRRGGRSFHSR